MEKRAGTGIGWKGWLLLLGGLLVGVLLGALIFFNGPDAGASAGKLPPTVGVPSPDFALGRLDDAKVSLSDFKGKPVIINFWATWCLPCREEMPLLDQVAAQHADALVVLGVNSGEPAELVQAYIDETGVKFPILLDTSEKVTEMYFVRNFPMTFFVDAEGILRAQHIGLLQENILARYLNTIGIEP